MLKLVITWDYTSYLSGCIPWGPMGSHGGWFYDVLCALGSVGSSLKLFAPGFASSHERLGPVPTMAGARGRARHGSGAARCSAKGELLQRWRC